MNVGAHDLDRKKHELAHTCTTKPGHGGLLPCLYDIVVRI